MKKKVKEIKKEKKESGRPKVRSATAFVERIADDLMRWVKKDTSLFLQAFMGEHKEPLNHENFSSWSKENKVFAETLCKVKQILVGRLHTKACMRVLDGSYVSKIMPLIDLEYRKWRQEELKIAEDNKNQRIEVIVRETAKE